MKDIKTMRNYWQENQSRAARFSKSGIIKCYGAHPLVIDNVHRLFYLGNENLRRKTYYSFNEVSACSIEHNNPIITTSKNLFGNPQSTIIQNKFLQVTLDTYSGRGFLTFPPTHPSLVAFFEQCAAESRRAQATKGLAISAADEIQKFKSLLDQCIITQAEFEMKKKQLLNL